MLSRSYPDGTLRLTYENLWLRRRTLSPPLERTSSLAVDLGTRVIRSAAAHEGSMFVSARCVVRTLSPHRLVPALLSLALTACGGAFHSAGSGVTNPSAGPPEVSFTLGDGTATGRIHSGDVLTLEVSAAPARFASIVDANGLPDPSRFSLTMSADLGDPAQGGVKAGDNLVPFLLAAGFAKADPPGGTIDVTFDIDTAAPQPFPEGLLIFSLTLQAD